ncbi:MAG: hypothetical protein ACFWTI_06285 [Lactobacillus helveticus]|jgi:macrolide transport system ATP-binding/permease protein
MSQPQLNKTILSINHVDFSYPNRNLFTDLSFSIAVGERIALIGPNGIGKSTLLNLIRNKIQPDHGRIIHHGEINYKLIILIQLMILKVLERSDSL